MRLSTRVAAGIVLLVALASALMWAATMHGVLHPLARSVFHAFQDEVSFVADRVEAGESPRQLGEELGLEVWRLRGGPRAHLRPRGQRHGPPVEVEHDGRKMLFHKGPRNVVIVETDVGWIGVRRDLDLERPGRQIRFAVLAGLLLMVLSAVALGRFATRPLLTAQQGMERIAAGDLEHRLPVGGPPELARMAHAFNQMADRIDQLVSTERQLLAGVSHELRTPLARLRLELELLRDSGAKASRLDAMEGDLLELDGLIAQLLALSRMQVGDTPLQLATTDVRDLVERAAQTAQVADVSIQGVATREVDPELMLRAVANLLSNAKRYGEAPIEVLVRPDRLTVRDAGPGVDEAELPHLFDAFWRAEGSRARSTGGLGLGLMLVKQVAELHQARVEAANRPGGGLEIALIWPTAGEAPPTRSSG
ncbi:MAG: HAMP domain-containing histidine kinase [Proteobacteria bacterium]|nr:HAMP domain-containing histidine kinase [Pseudomonadota bacterium]